MGAILAVLFAAAVGTAAGVTPNDDGQNIYKFDEAKQEFVLIENPSQELIDRHEAARLQSDKDDGPVVMEDTTTSTPVVSAPVVDTPAPVVETPSAPVAETPAPEAPSAPVADTTPSGPPADAPTGPTSGDLNTLAG